MRSLLARFHSLDWPLLAGVGGAVAIGILAITSVDLSLASNFALLKRQLLALLIGVVAMLIMSKFHPEFFRTTSRTWYFGGLILLGAVLIVGQTIRGTKGWFELGGFSFQPVEFMKVALVLVLARVIDRRGRAFHTGLFFFGTALVALLPMALVIVQPDLGSALILGAVWLWLVMFVGTRKAFIWMLIVSFVTVAMLGWFVFLKPYQKERLLSFVQPERDPLGTGYNVEQSKIAIGSGGFFGRGFGYGSQNQLNFLPERQTDFVFSVVGEELGFVGVIALFTCFIIIGWCITRRALLARDDFTLSILMGVFGLWLAQVVVNLGGTMGVLPVTGITLPFVSYGGSSLIMNLILLGVVQSVASHQVGGR